MRFLRHLAAAALVVAVVVLLGLAWNHFAASTLIGSLQGPDKQVLASGRPPGRPPPGAAAPGSGVPAKVQHGPQVIRLKPMNLGLGSMLNPVNLADLRHTAVIEAGVMAAVVIIEANVRLSRRARRARQLAAEEPDDDDGTVQ
jgi:hypothetical protein